jgi:hypothetical protein
MFRLSPYLLQSMFVESPTRGPLLDVDRRGKVISCVLDVLALLAFNP